MQKRLFQCFIIIVLSATYFVTAAAGPMCDASQVVAFKDLNGPQTCAEATAEMPKNLKSRRYRKGCQTKIGNHSLPKSVAAVWVTECREAGSRGSFADVEVCCHPAAAGEATLVDPRRYDANLVAAFVGQKSTISITLRGATGRYPYRVSLSELTCRYFTLYPNTQCSADSVLNLKANQTTTFMVQYSAAVKGARRGTLLIDFESPTLRDVIIDLKGFVGAESGSALIIDLSR